jgi:universal stress protein A
MAQYKKILVATDLSDNSQELLKHATELAELYQAQLYLVHVIDQAPFTYMDEFSLPLDPELESDLEKPIVQKSAITATMRACDCARGTAQAILEA